MRTSVGRVIYCVIALSMVGCTKATTVLSDLGLLSREFGIYQSSRSSSIIKVNATDKSTTFNVDCNSTYTDLKISYDSITWSSVPGFTCASGAATISYTVPAPITLTDGSTVDFPRIAFMIKAIGAEVESVAVARQFVIPTFITGTMSVDLASGATVTNQTSISASLFAEQTGGGQVFPPSEVYVTETPGCASGGAWQPYATSISGITLSTPNTLNYTYVMFRDEVGNESSCINDSILLDLIGPTPQTLAINSGDPQTTSLSVTLSISATNGPTQMKLNNSNNCAGGGAWETYNATKAWTLAGPGANWVSVKFRDVTGNESACLADSITYDTDPPVTPTSLTLNTGTSSVDNDDPVTVIVAPVIEGDTASLYSDAGCTTLVTAGVGDSTQKAAVDVALGADGSYTFYAKVTDVASIVSGCSTASVTYTLDTVIPTVLSVTSTTANGNYVSGTVIPIQVTFSKNIVVTGSPILNIEVLGLSIPATYVSGSGTSTLVFNYTITSLHTSADLDVDGTAALSLNGGTLLDAYGNIADLTLPYAATAGSLSQNKDLRINYDVTITNIIGPSPRTYFSFGNDPLNFAVQWSGPVTLGGVGTPILKVNMGGSLLNALYVPARSTPIFSVFEISTGYLNDTDGIVADSISLGTATIKNSFGANATITFAPVTYSTVTTSSTSRPTISFTTGTATEVNEGAGAVSIPIQISASQAVNVSVEYSVLLSSTASSADHTLVPGSVTIPSGSTTASIAFSVTDDALAEGHEVIALTLTGTSGGMIDTANQVKDIVIVDNEATGEFVVDLSAGYDHACSRTNLGRLLCWGANARGQIGNGTLVDSISPVEIFSSGVTDVAVGQYFSCAIVSARVYCWGYNFDGSVGNGDNVNQLSPVQVSVLSNNVIDISAGNSHVCAIYDFANRYVSCWGDGLYGRLGTNSVSDRNTPSSAIISAAQKVSAGYSHTCALTGATPTLYCWGSNTSGELGIGSTTYKTTPQLVTNNSGGTLADVLASSNRTMILTTTGAVYCWGTRNYCGRLETGSQLTMPTAANWTVASGVLRLVERYSDISTYVQNTSLSYSTWTSGNLPAAAPTIGSAKAFATIGSFGSIYTDVSGLRLSTTNSQMLTISNTTIPTATAVSLPVSLSAISGDSSNQGQCYLTTAGALYCTGYYSGDGYSSIRYGPPTRVFASGVLKVASGYYNGCAIRTDHSLWCWGGGGQVGDGGGTTRLTPVLIMAGVEDVQAGYGHFCAKTQAGALYCWGQDAYGQVGNGAPLTTTSAPAQIFASGVQAFSVGQYFSCAVVAGVHKCWGDNTNGQLGDLSGSNQAAPVDAFLVDASETFASTSAGTHHVCGLLTSGVFRCWGLGTSGQLGRGNTASLPFPATNILTDAISYWLYNATTCARKADSGLHCWGSSNGSSTANILAPSPTANFTNVTDVWLGSTSIIKSNGQTYLWGARNLFYNRSTAVGGYTNLISGGL